jgi:glyoxylase-like metal-dependent hydrolase (beta-lactamase superfamily II)
MPVLQPSPPATGTLPQVVTGDVAFIRTAIVNVIFVGEPGAGDREWVMIDAGMPGTTRQILDAAEERFMAGSRPAAILLTHGHFDHVGALKELSEAWDVDIWAHPLEIPYLTDRSAYPPPDATVGGGAMAALAWMYPRQPIDVSERLRVLPEDGTLPWMPGWEWLHTPGHTPGHVSFFRSSDRVLIAGDAFVTTKQESLVAVLAQRGEMHGPPAYFTPDWESARNSVRTLASLEPEFAVTGHGPAMQGASLRQSLHELANNFDTLAMPTRGRYVGCPAVADERGVLFVPPADPVPRVLVGVGLAAAVVAAALAIRHARSD